jgi:hypothetical protein
MGKPSQFVLGALAFFIGDPVIMQRCRALSLKVFGLPSIFDLPEWISLHLSLYNVSSISTWTNNLAIVTVPIYDNETHSLN